MSEQKKIQTADDRPQTANPIPEDDGMAEGHGISIPEACRELGDETEFVHPADLADHLENLSLEKQVCALRHMPTEDAAEALAELEGSVAVDVLENLDADVAAQIIAEMEPDDAADVLDELDEEHRDVLLGKLTREDSEELRNLLNFDPDSAAGVMNTELILLEENMTADEAITHIRSEMEDKESPYYAYVVDRNDKLVGVLSLRDLMLARPGTIVGDAVAGQSVVSVPYDMDKGEVANLLSHYNYLAMPVVDYEGHIMGVVTYDDIMDIMHEEASADMLGMVGADPEESVDTPWKESVRKRLPWLVVNMVNSALSASVVYMFEGSIAQMAALAVLMPMVANQAGNTGQQALAVMIRQLATDRFEPKKAWMAVLREAKIGLVTGLFMSILALCGAWGFTGNPLVGMVMAGALLCDMMLGAVAGGSIPLIFRALGRDPAQASSIFLTTITDGAGFFIFLGLATMFLF
ncbi:magnesium transporter [Desulfovibrio piger]|uniref:Magnesium transporter MgtE n=2 Tax=Desulfovibrio piger TaxID=901 RepID=A0A1K1LBA8_9BACT|nr:magnesium transporter [Desulfovibrio piger]SFV71993.1 Mg/Co/Ni transporter MgtE / CBS domain [Desulfovibrio piger]